MQPKPSLDPSDTRPLDVQPLDVQPSDTRPLGVRPSDTRPPDPEPAANAPAAEIGFVGGFRAEPRSADGSFPGDPDPVLDESPEDILGRPPAARDVADELAAPPRRKLPAMTLALGAGAFLAVGFLAGVEVQKDHDGGASPAADGARAGAQPGGGTPYGGRASGGAAQAQPGGAAQPGAGQTGGAASAVTTGTVKVVDDSFIYVSDSTGNIVKVKTDAGTKIQVTRDGRTVDLKPGDTVVVRGETGADGSVAATAVTEGTAGAGRTGAGGFGGTGAAGGAGGAGGSGAAGGGTATGGAR